MLGSSGPWPWWCCGPAVLKARRIARKREKKQWIKEEKWESRSSRQTEA